jgi:hypothetical protein
VLAILAAVSVLIVRLCHLASNVFFGGVFMPLFAGADRGRYFWLFIGLAWTAVFALFSLGQPARGKRVIYQQ